jgi:hypothetical protein
MENYDSIKIKVKYFNFIYRQFFSYIYANLPLTKKKLFKNQDQFESIKYDFKCVKNYIYSIYGTLTTFSLGASYMLYDKLTPYLFLKSKVISTMKYPFLALIGFTTIKLISNIPVDIYQILPRNSKFHIYLIFETNFRNETLPLIIDSLDLENNRLFDEFNKSETKNLEKLDLFLFYHDIKTHYLCMYLIHKLLLNFNGKRYLHMFDKYIYYDEDIKKDLFYYLRKSIYKEFSKMFSNKQNGIQDELETPIINNENYTKYFDEMDSILMIQEEILKQGILKEYKI